MITRMQFLRSLAGASVGVLGAAALAGCKDDNNPSIDAPGGQPDAPAQPIDASTPIDAPAVDAPPPTCDSANGTIATNHGHTIAVPPADLTAGLDQTYDITGTSLHSHLVDVTAAQFTMLRASGSLSVTSSTGAGHTHVVTLTCA